MLGRACVIGVTLVLSANVYAGSIYKCVSAEGTAYQSAPCATGSEEVLAVTTSAESHVRPSDDVHAATQPVTGPVAVSTEQWSADTRVIGRNSLTLGITDDQALNTPGWGPPKKIIRHRERAGWREVWTYARKDGGAPQLEFFNGRLVAISMQSQFAKNAGMISAAAQ